jgi:hypothetical protein
MIDMYCRIWTSTMKTHKSQGYIVNGSVNMWYRIIFFIGYKNSTNVDICCRKSF